MMLIEVSNIEIDRTRGEGTNGIDVEPNDWLSPSQAKNYDYRNRI